MRVGNITKKLRFHENTQETHGKTIVVHALKDPDG